MIKLCRCYPFPLLYLLYIANYSMVVSAFLQGDIPPLTPQHFISLRAVALFFFPPPAAIFIITPPDLHSYVFSPSFLYPFPFSP